MTSHDAQERFRRLYELHYGEIFAFARRRCRDPTEAHDVVADTFLVLWRRLADAPPDAEIALWLYGVARRVLGNRLRTRRRRERLFERLNERSDQLVGTTTEAAAEARAESRALVESLQALADADREILLLAAWEQLSAAQIAVLLRCTENAAAIRLHRARKRLASIHVKEAGRSGHIDVERPHLRRRADEERRG